MIVDSTFHSVYISTVRKRGENMKTVDSTFHSVYISTNNKEVHVDKDVPLHSTLFILVPVSTQSYRYLSTSFLFCLPLFFTAIIFLIHFYLSLLLHFFLYFLSLSFSYDIFIITGRQLQKSARFIILHANKFFFQPPFIT